MSQANLRDLAVTALNDLKAIDLTLIDVRDITTIADTMIICTGRSSRHVKSMAENIITEAKRQQVSYLNFEGQEAGEWIIVDLGDVVVHVMQPAAREFYNLEDLWEPMQLQREQSR